MKLYLIQHGDAVGEQVDPERPLSLRGRADIEGLAAQMLRDGVEVERIINSGKLRARQTADMIAAVIAPTLSVEDIADGLRPKDSTDWLAGSLEQWTGDTLAVGHLPFMAKMVSRLVTGSDNTGVVSFVPGTGVCLARGENTDGWTIDWMIKPDLLRP